MKTDLLKTSIVIMFLALTGCSHYVVNNAGYIRPPKNYKFSYRKNASKLTNNDLIDTAAVYYLANSDFYRYESQYKNNEHYIRFYSDGRFKLQSTQGVPIIEDINDITKGVVGYYKLNGRVIKLQIYSDIDGGSDQLKFGMFDEDSNLILLHENPRTYFRIGYSEEGIKRKIASSSPLNPKRYTKLNIDGMTYISPDW